MRRLLRVFVVFLHFGGNIAKQFSRQYRHRLNCLVTAQGVGFGLIFGKNQAQQPMWAKFGRQGAPTYARPLISLNVF